MLPIYQVVHMAATAIARSPGCWSRRAGFVNDKRVERIWRREGAPQTTHGRQAVANGRIMHPAASRAPQSRLVL
jgi:hypothetical protein